MKVQSLIVVLIMAAVASLSITSTPFATSTNLTACDSLIAFVNASQAQSGKNLTAGQVKQPVGASTEIKSDRDCQ